MAFFFLMHHNISSMTFYRNYDLEQVSRNYVYFNAGLLLNFSNFLFFQLSVREASPVHKNTV